jgi:hypothetical protein
MRLISFRTVTLRPSRQVSQKLRVSKIKSLVLPNRAWIFRKRSTISMLTLLGCL